MKIVNEQNISEIASVLNSGGIVVLRTDTIYGVVACADDEKAREKIFAVKGRDADKKCIVLIADERQMWDKQSRAAFRKAYDAIPHDYPASIIVPTGAATPPWVTHGSDRIAFRIPDTKPWLVKLLGQTGPLIAPSANPQGSEPAVSIDEATTYFGDAIDLYVDGGGVKTNEPSRIYDVWDERIDRLR